MDTPKKPARAKLPSQGPGWGGPAKGASGKPAKPFNGQPGPGRGHMTDPEKRALNAERAEKLRDLLYEIAFNGEHETNRINAAKAMLDRIEGMPVATQRISGPDGGPIQTQKVMKEHPSFDALLAKVRAKVQKKD